MVPIPGEAMLILPGLAARGAAEVRNGRGPERWADLHHEWGANDTCDGRDVAGKIEIEILVKRRTDGVHGSDRQQGISIGNCAHYHFGRGVSGGAGPVLDNELLTEPI